MKSKFVVAALLAAAVLTGLSLYLKRNLETAAPSPAVPETEPVPVVGANTAVDSAPPAPPLIPSAASALTPEQREAAIESRVDLLQQWSMKSDPASLAAILAELTNPEKEIREAAIEAVKEFGDTNAIPVLKAAAEHTEDLEEKIAFLEAANFLSVPPMNFDSKTVRTPEQLQASRERREARRQARLERSMPSRAAPGTNAPALP